VLRRVLVVMASDATARLSLGLFFCAAVPGVAVRCCG
jgi:hypothetical protein